MQDVHELEHAVVVPHMFDPVELARNLNLWNMKYLPWKHRNLAFKLPIPDQSRRILELIDGSRTLKEIYNLLMDSTTTIEVSSSFGDFVRGPFRTLYKSLNGINKLYLTWTHAPVQRLLTLDHNVEISQFMPRNSYHAPAVCSDSTIINKGL